MRLFQFDYLLDYIVRAVSNDTGRQQAVVTTPVVVLVPYAGREAKFVELLRRDVSQAVTLVSTATIFDLREVDDSALFSNNVNLADPGLPVLSDNLIAVSG